MTISINKVILIGKVADDIEVREFTNGKHVANFSLCTEESWIEKSGQKRTSHQYHRIAVFNDRLVTILKSIAGKDTLVMIEGQIENRKYVDNKNIDRIATDIVIRPFKGSMVVLDPTNTNTMPGDIPTYGTVQADGNYLTFNPNNEDPLSPF